MASTSGATKKELSQLIQHHILIRWLQVAVLKGHSPNDETKETLTFASDLESPTLEKKTTSIFYATFFFQCQQWWFTNHPTKVVDLGLWYLILSWKDESAYTCQGV